MLLLALWIFQTATPKRLSCWWDVHVFSQAWVLVSISDGIIVIIFISESDIYLLTGKVETSPGNVHNIRSYHQQTYVDVRRSTAALAAESGYITEVAMW